MLQGLPVLVELVEERYVTDGQLLHVGINCIWRVLELHGPVPVNTLCRLLGAAGLALRLVRSLAAVSHALRTTQGPVQARLLLRCLLLTFCPLLQNGSTGRSHATPGSGYDDQVPSTHQVSAGCIVCRPVMPTKEQDPKPEQAWQAVVANGSASKHVRSASAVSGASGGPTEVQALLGAGSLAGERASSHNRASSLSSADVSICSPFGTCQYWSALPDQLL